MSEDYLEDFSVGEVISQSFSVLSRNIVSFTGLAAIVYVPVFLFNLYYGVGGDPAQLTVDANAVYAGAGGVIFLVVFSYLVYGAVTYGTIRDMQGRPAPFGEILSRGVSTFLPVLGVSIVSSMAIFIGLIFLVVPGIIIALMVYVAIPVVVIERPGVFESLSRSAELTKDFRGKIFGLAVVILLINMVVGVAIGIFTFAGSFIYSIADIVLNSFSIALGAVVAAVAYQELRRVKEGVDIDTIASVFS